MSCELRVKGAFSTGSTHCEQPPGLPILAGHLPAAPSLKLVQYECKRISQFSFGQAYPCIRGRLPHQLQLSTRVE